MMMVSDLKKAIANANKKSKDKASKSKPDTSTASLMIEQKLNSLFYLKPKPKEEGKFVMQVLLKNGAAQERIGLHASAMIASESDFCLRQQVLSLLYKQSQGHSTEIGLKRIFEEGNSIHEKWQRLFIRGDLGAPEDMDRTRSLPEYDLNFTPDACPLLIGNKEWVCEIKSMNTFSFQKSNSHPSGEKQLQFYMHLTGIHRGFVLAEDKNTQNFKVFPVKYDPQVVQPFVARLEDIQDAKQEFLEGGKPPIRHAKCTNCNDKKALQCGMKDACFNVGIGRVKLGK